MATSMKRGREHVSPVKGCNRACKMTVKEAKASLAHIEASLKAGKGNEAAIAQRRRAIKRRILAG